MTDKEILIRVDSHLHPNLPKNQASAKLKAKKWWESLSNIGVNTIISTEHVYKNPRIAYEVMEDMKPTSSHIFPGMEYITKEGIDVILFKYNSDLYKYSELTPYSMKIEYLIDFCINNNIDLFIPHPYTIGTTSVIRLLGHKKYLDLIKEISGVEISNTSLNSLRKLLKKKVLREVFHTTISRLNKVNHLPINKYELKFDLLTVGSDAHNFHELGIYREFYSLDDRSEIFQKVKTNKNTNFHTKPVDVYTPIELIESMFTVFDEYLIKHKYKFFNKL